MPTQSLSSHDDRLAVQAAYNKSLTKLVISRNKSAMRIVRLSGHQNIMKTKILSITAALAALTSLASPVRAGDRGDKVAAAIGGFIGGVIVGSHFDRGDRCSPPVVVRGHSHGHWETVSRRVWIPARWVVTVDSCGRRMRSQVGGCYETRTERVWIDHGYNDRVVVSNGYGRY